MKEQNKTALVLDDEMLIALDVEAMLFDLGYAQVTVVPSVGEALDYLKNERPDAAVIDYHVRGRNCEPVAGALRSLNVPTIIHSGTNFDPDYHGPFFADFPWLAKPSSREHLASALAAAIDQSKLTTDSNGTDSIISPFSEVISNVSLARGCPCQSPSDTISRAARTASDLASADDSKSASKASPNEPSEFRT